MLTSSEKKQWAENGYCITINKLNHQDLLDSRTFIYNNKDKLQDRSDFGSELEFPYKNPALNYITLNKDLIKTVKQLLKTEDILLTQSTAWLKYGPTNKDKDKDKDKKSNDDQRMHMDFPNHNILVPSSFDRPDSVAIIIYLDYDYDYLQDKPVGGQTVVVPRLALTENDPLYQGQYSLSPGLSEKPWINNKIEAERYFFKNDITVFNFRTELYKRSIKLRYSMGSILFYRHDIYHRGTPIMPSCSRAVINLVFKRKDCFHIHSWNKGPARSMYDHSCLDVGFFEKFLVTLNEDQRATLGFPLCSDNIWTIDFITDVMNRYNFDKFSTLYLDLDALLKKKQKVIKSYL